MSDELVAVEMAPPWASREPGRGVLLEGPVGSRILGRSRWVRYEVRRWPGGTIPDLAYAVAGPVEVGTDEDRARRLLERRFGLRAPALS